MLEWALEPLHYAYMRNAIGVSALVGASCAFLSAFVVLKGWSLMGDALSHSVMLGVAAAYALGLPYAAGAFVTGLLAALTMALTRHLTRRREEDIIGYVFSTFFAAGLLLVSLNPTAVNVQTILFGNILAIAAPDVRQVQWISGITFAVLFFLRKDLLVVFFDETHARSLGLAPLRLKLVFFVLLSASIIAALQTVGTILVMAMVITPGATRLAINRPFFTSDYIVGRLWCRHLCRRRMVKLFCRWRHRPGNCHPANAALFADLDRRAAPRSAGRPPTPARPARGRP